MTAFTRKSIINRHPFTRSPECIYEKYTEERVLCSSTLSIESEKAEQGAAVHFKRLVLHSRNSRQLNIRPTRSRVLVQGDTEKNVLPGIPESAVCVRKFDDSLNSAIRNTYRSLLRSSSLREPRYPLLRVVQHLVHRKDWHTE